MKNSLIPGIKILFVIAVLSAFLLSCKDKSEPGETKDKLSDKRAEQTSDKTEENINKISDKSYEQTENITKETTDIRADKSNKKTVEKTKSDIEIKSRTVNKTINKKPVHLTKQDFIDKVMDYEKNPDNWVFKGDLPCMIDFYADWCAPCRITAPILDELAESYAGKINIYKIDIEREKELSSIFGIQSIPAFLYCPLKGRPSITSGIARTAEETRQLFISQIESLLLDTGNASEL